jgi:hypothetical protein
MRRKPNYRFERQERDRIKAAKKAERRQTRTEQPDADGAEVTNDNDNADRSASEPANEPASPDQGGQERE